MVFPEGVKGTGKPFSERYRLQRFGRGGFVEIALRTGSPIVPVAVVGSEEIYPKLGESRPLARATGAPVRARSPRPSRGSGRSAWSRCPRAGGSSSASRSTSPTTRPRRPTTSGSSSTSPSRSARRSRRSSTRTWSSGARRSSERATLREEMEAATATVRATTRAAAFAGRDARRARPGAGRRGRRRADRPALAARPGSRMRFELPGRRHRAPRRARADDDEHNLDLVVRQGPGVAAEARARDELRRSPTATSRGARASRSRSPAGRFAAAASRARRSATCPRRG